MPKEMSQASSRLLKVIQTWLRNLYGGKGIKVCFIFQKTIDHSEFTESVDDFQLITWSKDRTLRFWPIDAEVMQVSYVVLESKPHY